MTTQTQYQQDACSSCNAPIIWTVTTRGKPMPVDAEPVDVNHGGGNVLLTARHPLAPLAKVVTNPAHLFGARTVYRSHFVTCPFAARHRRPRTRGRS